MDLHACFNTLDYYKDVYKRQAEDYTVKSWAAYQPVRDKAEALMATMFDAEGNPTDDNKAAANESIEKMAAELKAASQKLDKNASSDAKTDVQYAVSYTHLDVYKRQEEAACDYRPDEICASAASRPEGFHPS